ncbi:MAG: LacI family DNA-binding transcriptional regulator [Armatimonadota bacterium]
MAVTQRDIAERVGVSVNTVSLVLRGAEAPLVSDGTRERVVEVARELGYRPNPHATALAGGHAPLIKICSEPKGTYVADRKAAALIQALRGLDREVTFGESIPRHDPEAAVQQLAWGSPQAVVFPELGGPMETIVPLAEGLHDEGIYMLVADLHLDADLDDDVPCDTVRFDRAGAVRRAVEHLLQLGHRQIALVTFDRYHGRQEGYTSALQAAGINESHIARISIPQSVAGTFDHNVYFARQASEHIRRLFSEHRDITGLVCRTDMASLGVMTTLREMGIDVPGDVSIVSFRNDPWTEFMDVPLTTMAEPVEEACKICRELIGARFEGDKGPWRREILEYQLIERASTAPATG